MAAGDYTPTVWQNGPGVGHPPINATNLNHIENKLYELDGLMASDFANYRFEELKSYFWMRNCKEIHMFDDSSLWGASGCDVGEASTPMTGNDDVTFHDTDNLAGSMYIDDTIASLDLEKFNDGEVSGVDDIIVFSVHLFTHTFFTSITLYLGTNAANYYSYTWNPGESYQVTFQAKKSAFGVGAGAPDWGTISYVRVQVVTTAGAQIKFVTPLALMMYRNDAAIANDGFANPFQRFDGSSWSNFFEWDTPAGEERPCWNLLFDPAKNDLGIICLNDYNVGSVWNGIKVKSGVVSFIWKSIFHTYVDYTNNMTWYVDSDNYATCWIDNDDFTLIINEAGAPTPYTFTLSTSLEKELLTIKLEKNGQTIRAILEKGNERVAILEHLTTITATTAGDLYYGYDAQGLSFITDFMISNINNMDLDVWDKPKLVIKKEDESKSSDAALAADTELYAYLPPNSFFEVYLSLVYISSNATPDIKVDWLTSGNITFITNRQSLGVPDNITDANDCNVKISDYGQTSAISYGSEGGTDESIAREWFIIKTGVNGGKLSVRWAQNTSNATASIIKSGSYIKITKCDLLQNN